MAEVFTVHHGLTYRAELQLSFFESMASNDMVAEKFHELGFRHITVSGEGDQRWAQGTWDGPDESVPLTDEHVISVVEVKAPRAMMQGMGMVEGDDIGHHPDDQDEPILKYNPFNPAYPDANANNNVG